MANKHTTIKPTTYPTPTGVFQVVACSNVGAMKSGQTGRFEFQQMRFSTKIMVTGTFWDWLEYEEPFTKQIERMKQNEAGFYKPMTLEECLETFEFELLADMDFEKLFKDFKPVAIP